MGKRGRLCGQIMQSAGLPIHTPRSISDLGTDNQIPLDCLELSGRDRFTSLDSEFIDPLVLWMTVMTTHPMEADDMELAEFIQLLPEINILYRLLSRSLPSSSFPAVDPFLEPLEYILGVGIELHEAWHLEIGQPLDDRLEFHAIVGGVAFSAGLFALFACSGVDEEVCPPAWTGIPGARSIGEEVNLALGSIALRICGESLGHRADHTHPIESCWEVLV